MDSEPPLISVVVPCFNQGHFLGEALDSLRSQTYANWECVVIDDGSTDTTPHVAKGYLSADPRIRYLRQENRGGSAARNLGLAHARGKFIQFLDADDLIHPAKLEIQVAGLRTASERSLAICNYRFGHGPSAAQTLVRLDLDRPAFRTSDHLRELVSRWETDLSIPIHAFLFAACLFDKRDESFDSTLPTHEDWDCWLRIFATRPQVVKNAEVLAVYRIHGASKTNDLRRMWRGVRMICDKHLALHGADRDLARELRRKRSSMRSRYYALMLREKVRADAPFLMWLYRRCIPSRTRELVRRRLGLSR